MTIFILRLTACLLVAVSFAAAAEPVAPAFPIPLDQYPITSGAGILDVLKARAGGGKANQYFLRGFNLDHGTDFAASLDGVPLNLSTHAHGQRYLDFNFLIPKS